VISSLVHVVISTSPGSSLVLFVANLFHPVGGLAVETFVLCLEVL